MSGFKSQAKNWIRGHDVLLYYQKSKEFTFNKEYLPLDSKTIKRYDKIDTDGRRYKIYRNKNGTERFSYLREDRGAPVSNVWKDIPSFQKVNNTGEFLNYPTQKPLALLERIIKASSNPGDLVFDPFCGCATTLVAADRLGRDWTGIDISSKAVDLVNNRIKEDQGESAKQQGLFVQITARNDIPQRTDIEVLKLYNSLDNKKHLYGQQAGNCNGCSTHFEMRHLEVDHIIAKSQGGTDHIENLQLLCGNCNRVKGNRGQEYLIAKLEGRRVKYA